MRRLALMLLLWGLALPASAQLVPAPSAPGLVRPEVARVVEQALLRMEGEPPAALFAHLGEAGRDHLIRLTTDGSRPVGLRRRAVIALQHYADAVARAELERLATAESEDPIVSRYALRSLAIAFGADVWSVLRRALEDRRAVVREGAVLALAQLDPDRAATVVAPLLPRESDGVVRSAMRALIER